MKLMRSRIRLISLVLSCVLVFLLIWGTRYLLFPLPEETVTPSSPPVSSADPPSVSPSPDPAFPVDSVSPLPAETVSPDQDLFNTYGL